MADHSTVSYVFLTLAARATALFRRPLRRRLPKSTKIPTMAMRTVFATARKPFEADPLESELGFSAAMNLRLSSSKFSGSYYFRKADTATAGNERYPSSFPIPPEWDTRSTSKPHYCCCSTQEGRRCSGTSAPADGVRNRRICMCERIRWRQLRLPRRIDFCS